MSGTGKALDLKARNMPDCAENELSKRSPSWNIFDMIIRGEVLDMTVQRNVPRGQSVAETCFRHWGQVKVRTPDIC